MRGEGVNNASMAEPETNYCKVFAAQAEPRIMLLLGVCIASPHRRRRRDICIASRTLAHTAAKSSISRTDFHAYPIHTQSTPTRERANQASSPLSLHHGRRLVAPLAPPSPTVLAPLVRPRWCNLMGVHGACGARPKGRRGGGITRNTRPWMDGWMEDPTSQVETPWCRQW